ncbi:MAG: DUF308 domain-containing protein [Bacteroides sp.]|nr:DUF308 domain-containing protein [Bacteroides sp.]
MRTMNHSIVRSICAVLVGVLLVAWSDAAAVYLVIAVGAMFLLPGIVAVVTYLLKGRNAGMPFPLVSVGSALFGLWLMIMPVFFVSILMYVLGAVLMFAGVSQLVNLVSARRWTQVPAGYYVVPVLILAAGLVVLLNPFAAASVPFMIVGVSCIVYGVSSLVNQIRFRKEEVKPVIEEAEIVDVTPIEEN